MSPTAGAGICAPCAAAAASPRTTTTSACAKAGKIFLIDTSAWIDYLRGKETKAAEAIEDILENDYPFGICAPVYQEILQGAASESDYQRFRDYFGTHRFYHPRHPVESYAQAAHLYFRCRKKGVTVRSTIDCLIAQIAIEHKLLLVYNDADFERLAGVIPELRLYA